MRHDTNLNIRIPRELKDRLDEYAAKRYTSTSEVIRQSIINTINEDTTMTTTDTATRLYPIISYNVNEKNAPERLRIFTTPGRKNMSHEPCTDGWLGTTNDVYSRAMGEYEGVGALAAWIRDNHKQVWVYYKHHYTKNLSDDQIAAWVDNPDVSVYVTNPRKN